MQNQTIVGIDVSSATLDICLVNSKGHRSLVLKNEVTAISKFFRSYQDECLIIGMENTGRYNWALYEVLKEMSHRVFVISPLHLKKSMGLIRGKNDKIRGKERVSSYADKAIKTTLHLAAMSAIRLKNDLREYYLRKVAEGKNKMSILNAVRNKIVHRIYAVIKNQTIYKTRLLLS